MQKTIRTIKEILVKNGVNVFDVTQGKNHLKVDLVYGGKSGSLSAPCTPSDFRSLRNWEHQLRRKLRTLAA
jgi:hypothetical protein